MEDFKWVPKLIRREMITFPPVFECAAYYANQLAMMVLRIATNTPIIEIPAIKPAATGTKYDSACSLLRFVQYQAIIAPTHIDSGYWNGRINPKPIPVAEGR